HVAFCATTQGCSSTLPLQLSSTPLLQISLWRLETAGFESSQSCPPVQWSSPSPSPSTSRSACAHVFCASMHESMSHALAVEHATTGPGAQPVFLQTSLPLQ